MRLDKELMDIGVLGEGFGITHLWGMREWLIELRQILEDLKEKAIYYQQLKQAVEFETRLHYVCHNLELVEAVMNVKELDIFEVTEYAEICLN